MTLLQMPWQYIFCACSPPSCQLPRGNRGDGQTEFASSHPNGILFSFLRAASIRVHLLREATIATESGGGSVFERLPTSQQYKLLCHNRFVLSPCSGPLVHPTDPDQWQFRKATAVPFAHISRMHYGGGRRGRNTHQIRFVLFDQITHLADESRNRNDMQQAFPSLR